MRVLSYSHIQAHWACPRLYYYRYLAQVPSPQVETRAVREGIWVHEQLHLDYLGHNPDLAHKAEWQLLWQNYLKETAPFSRAGSWSEWACHVPLEAGTDSIWLMGRMDRLYLQKQELTLLDWKTGRAGPGESTELQLDFYIWLLWMARSLLAEQPVEKIRARAVWLNLPETVLEREAKAADIPALAARFQALIRPLEEEEIASLPHPRSVNGKLWCTMCEYQPLCPEGKYHA